VQRGAREGAAPQPRERRARDREVRRVGSWQPLVDALRVKVLAGALLSPRTCPHCGRPPDDFADEETVVEERAQDGTQDPQATGTSTRAAPQYTHHTGEQVDQRWNTFVDIEAASMGRPRQGRPSVRAVAWTPGYATTPCIRHHGTPTWRR
jgi:hypothetical protein